jgi:uncharacterized protein
MDQFDRIEPTLPPRGIPLMKQRWSHLLFLHWRIAASQLRPLVPGALEIDTFEGDAYVGIIPFTISGTRPIIAPPLPGMSSFHETNVRTYVHREGRDPGVYFFSLDASSRLAVMAARAAYRLPYHYARMRFNILHGPSFDHSTNRVDSEARCHVVWSAGENLRNATPGTLEFFLIERYILYSNDRSTLYSARVSHKPYPIRDATVARLDETLCEVNGMLRPQRPPLVHYSSGVDVKIFRPIKLK